MTAALDVALGADLSEIHRLAELIEAFGAAHAIPERTLFTLTLALDELLTNVIEHAFDSEAHTGAEHEIRVRMRLADGVVTAEIIDNGAPYDPTARPDPDTTLSVDERPVGGLGVFFVKRLMDRVEYVRDGNRNRLRLWRRIDTPETHEEAEDVLAKPKEMGP